MKSNDLYAKVRIKDQKFCSSYSCICLIIEFYLFNTIELFYFQVFRIFTLELQYFLLASMALFYQTAVIITIMAQIALGSIMNLQYNHIHTINQNIYLFSQQATVTKVHQDYLYISQATQKIRKINLITGTQQGVFLWASGISINDFTIFANGTKIAACYGNSKLVIWNTTSFTNILMTPQNCSKMTYFDDVNRLIFSKNYETNQIQMKQADSLLTVCDRNLYNFPNKHKVYFSSDKKALISFEDNFQYTIGRFSYNSSSMQFSYIQSGSLISPSYYNRVFTAENVPFDFYLLSSTQITQVTVNSGAVSFYHHGQSDTVIAFNQIVNDRVAYVMNSSSKSVNFIGKGEFNGSYAFTLPESIRCLQTSVDKRKLILILKTQIQVFQFSCLNDQYYDPTTFDCLACPIACLSCYANSQNCSSCLPGLFVNNQTCSACDPSCQACTNITGCLTCAGNLTQAGIGLLCKDATNLTLPQNTTENIYSQILDAFIQFIQIPSALKIPLQSSLLILIADFWIYNYHNRTYGQKIAQVFQLIQSIENQKWAFAKFDKHLNITLNPHYLGFSNYSNYSNPKFLAVEQKGSTFVESLQQFFLYFTPIVILIFFLYRIIFYVTSNYRISQYFRLYSLNYYIVFLLTEGNFEYICYCCFNQSQILYFFNFIDKANALFYLIFFFLTTVHGFGGFYITYWFYPKIGSKFIDEAKVILPSFAIYTIMTNGKNFLLAAIQSLLFKFYRTQMFAMLGVHFLLIVVLLYFQKKYGIFRRAIFFSYLLLQATIKILINFFFLIQYSVQEGDNAAFDIVEDCLIITLYIWGIVIIFLLISYCSPLVKKVVQLSTKSLQKEKEKMDDSANSEKVQLKQLSTINEKLNNSLKFANRQTIIITELQNREPEPKIKSIIINNQPKIRAKSQDYPHMEQKGRRHRQNDMLVIYHRSQSQKEHDASDQIQVINMCAHRKKQQ